MSICLCMIVKDEAASIARCLASAKPFISTWCIVDTGSTDGTQALIRKALVAVPGVLHERPWVDFAHNRTEAIRLAEQIALPSEHLLFLDADDWLEADAGFALSKLLPLDLYDAQIRHGFITHWRPLLARARLAWRYEGVVHEYLACDGAFSRGRLEGLRVVIGGKPATPAKYAAHARLLETALQTEIAPYLRARYQFYLAQSYRDAGLPEEAQAAYALRATMRDGFAQEIYIALLTRARLLMDLGRLTGDVIEAWLAALQADPARAEAYGELARYLRTHGKCSSAMLFAEAGAKLPQQPDALFLEPDWYTWGCADELAIAYYWMGRYRESEQLCGDLLAGVALPPWNRVRVRRNLEEARRAQGLPPAARSVGFYRPGAIGDLLMTLHLVAPFKAAHPGVRVLYFCDRAIGQGLRYVMARAGIDEVLPVEALSRAECDRIYNLVGYPLAEGYPEKPMAKHLLSYFASELGLPEATIFTPFAIPNRGQHAPVANYVTLQVMPGWSKYKGWPHERWEAVIAAMPDVRFLQLGARGERPLRSASQRWLGKGLDVAVDLIAHARLHVGVDSFGHHAAHLYGVPSVVLWGSTQWQAAGYPEDTNLSLGLPCQPCFRESPAISAAPRGPCTNPPRATYEDETPWACMAGITVEQVVAAIRAKLELPQGGTKPCP